MKLYTKRGDDGNTDLFGGQRVSKHDPRVSAYGEVDEVNAAIGAAVAICTPAEIKAQLLAIQSDLFVVGGELAADNPERAVVKVEASAIARLEQAIDWASEQVAPLQNFVLPGGTPLSSALHLARTVCRRAERAVVAAAQDHEVRPVTIIYLNRLSDLLFALARLANHVAGVADIPWRGR